MTKANLADAYLSGSNLQGAFLTGACLCRARLIGAELQGVDFRGADLTQVCWEQLHSIAGADFTNVRGLSKLDLICLCNRPSQELGTWNPFTRSNTETSLGCFL